MPVQLKPDTDFALVGTPQPRIDAVDIVTRRKIFAMDLDVPATRYRIRAAIRDYAQSL